VSIVDSHGAPLCHGSIMDDEPNPEELEIGDNTKVVGWWKEVEKLSAVSGAGATELGEDEVFYSSISSEEYGVIPKRYRTISELCRMEEGIIVWHEYVVPRVRAEKKKARTKNK
jgi:hypothetical protein